LKKRKLGAGAMGVVFRSARPGVLDRDVAVKVLARHQGEDELRARFLREARIAARLRHPSIVAVHDVDEDAACTVMELVIGETLEERRARDGKQPAAEVRRIGIALLGGLAEAHAAGVVHRDIKPAQRAGHP
jgi:serine/threonine protein kinase